MVFLLLVGQEFPQNTLALTQSVREMGWREREGHGGERERVKGISAILHMVNQHISSSTRRQIEQDKSKQKWIKSFDDRSACLFMNHCFMNNQSTQIEGETKGIFCSREDNRSRYYSRKNTTLFSHLDHTHCSMESSHVFCTEHGKEKREKKKLAMSSFPSGWAVSDFFYPPGQQNHAKITREPSNQKS